MKSEKFFLYLLMAVLALFSFGFSFFVINPSLHYHFQQTAWHTGRLFFDYYLAFPGGPGEYITLFFSQWFFYKGIGSTIIAFSGFLVSFFLYKIINIKWKNYKLLVLLIPLVQVNLLALMCDYRYHFSVTINLVIVSGLLFLCTIIDKKKGFAISFYTILAGIIIYYISGGMYFLIFMVSSIILLLKKPDTKMFINGSIILATIFIIPFVAYSFVFLTSLNYSFFRSTPDVAVMLKYSKPIIFYVGLAAIPSIILVAKMSALFSLPQKISKTFRKKEIKSKRSKDKKLKSKVSHRLVSFIQLVVLTVVSVFILYQEYKPIEKVRIEIDYNAYQQNWEKVISMSLELEDYDRMVNFQYNRALLNTEQVLEKLYGYDQILGSLGLFLDVPFTAGITLPNSDIYFDLGNIDESLRYAFESETLMKNSPRVLKRLILNCIILDKMDAAHTYINILASNPIEKEWAAKYRALANNPKVAASDPLIMKKRKDMNKSEGMVVTPPLKLLDQLEKNPMNKGAFEYLIAIDLMEHDVASLEEDFKFINNFNYKKLPLVLEEAIILFRSQGKKNDFLNSIRVSKATSDRFREFAKLTSASKGDREKAKQATKAYQNTYWYYILFLSPRVTKLKLNTTPVDTNY